MKGTCQTCSGMEQTAIVGEARCFGQIACRGVVVAWGKREVVELLIKQVAVMVMKACMVGEGTSWRARGKGKKRVARCVHGRRKEQLACPHHACKVKKKQPLGC